jgi:hypothetical protein
VNSAFVLPRYFSEIYFDIVLPSRNRDSIVGIMTGYGLNDRGVGVRVPVGSRNSLLQVAQTGSGIDPTSYPMGTRGSIPGGKAAVA